MEKAEPVLNSVDRQSAVWMKIQNYLEARLAALRVRNDKELDQVKTAALRGRISEVKQFMALDKPVPPVQADDQGDQDARSG